MRAIKTFNWEELLERVSDEEEPHLCDGRLNDYLHKTNNSSL